MKQPGTVLISVLYLLYSFNLKITDSATGVSDSDDFCATNEQGNQLFLHYCLVGCRCVISVVSCTRFFIRNVAQGSVVKFYNF